jgi:hypothetical protein
MKLFERLFTKNLKAIPLLWIDFNYQLYKEKGKIGSCNLRLHPILVNDQYIKDELNHLVDYIRDNYDMKEM